MRKSISIRKAFVNSTFALSRLALIDHLASLPAKLTPAEAADRIIQSNRRSVLVSNGTSTAVMEVGEAAELEDFRDNSQIDFEMTQADAIPSWYTINTGDYTAKVCRETGKVSYEPSPQS